MSSSPYAPAAKILNEIWTRRKGLKTVVYSKEGELKCSTSTYAICCHVLKEKALLAKLLKRVPKIQAKNEGLVYILLFELLMGPNKKIRGGGALKRQIMSQIDLLQENFKKISEEEGWKDIYNATMSGTSSKSTTTIPRYLRINTLVADRDKVLEIIKAKTDEVYIDPHIPDLLVLDHTPQSRALLQDLVVSQKVILQDKSSCFSALCMAHGFGDTKKDSNSKGKKFDYLDACAAPGNKTSHLAALVHKMQQSDDADCISTIYALDKSPDRFKLLKRRISDLVPQGIVECHKEDFFEVSKRKYEENEDTNIIDVDKKFKNIQAIMLDPSCSGSGMTSNHTENSVSRDPFFSNDRIKTLSNFQYQALYHATTDFPRVNRVVYSTCSLYIQENEGVVQRLLASNSDWELCPPACLESWHRRGICIDEGEESNDENSFVSLTQEQAKCLIRVHPDEDAMNGFFVACFRRKMDLGKKTSSKNHVGIKINVPKGMELYDNQFHSQQKKNTSSEIKPSVELKKAKTMSSNAAENNDIASNAKRKINQISPTINAAAATSDGTSDGIVKKMAKKRAKKLEWRKRQRLKKEARLKSQTKKAETEAE